MVEQERGAGAMATEERLPPDHGCRSIPIALMAVKSRAYLEPFVLDGGLDQVRADNLSKEAMIPWSGAIAGFPIRSGLRANTLSPGALATGILDDYRRAFGDGMARNVTRAGTPAEFAHAAALVSLPEGTG